MENEVPLVKKTRCPKGQTRNKQGDCVANKEKVKKTSSSKKPSSAKKPSPSKKPSSAKKTVKPRIIKQKISPKTRKVKQIKKLTNKQLIQLVEQRRKCIERFRNKT